MARGEEHHQEDAEVVDGLGFVWIDYNLLNSRQRLLGGRRWREGTDEVVADETDEGENGASLETEGGGVVAVCEDDEDVEEEHPEVLLEEGLAELRRRFSGDEVEVFDEEEEGSLGNVGGGVLDAPDLSIDHTLESIGVGESEHGWRAEVDDGTEEVVEGSTVIWIVLEIGGDEVEGGLEE